VGRIRAAGVLRDFPGAGRSWVAPDGPFNEHLARDVGVLNLALAVVTIAAAVEDGRPKMEEFTERMGRAAAAVLPLGLLGPVQPDFPSVAQLAAECHLGARDLESGLVRLTLAHHRGMASCPGGPRCSVLAPADPPGKGCRHSATAKYAVPPQTVPEPAPEPVLAAAPLQGGAMLHQGVRGRREHALVTVFPPDQIRRCATVPVDLDDHSLAVRITHMASPDDQFIADLRTHRHPPSHSFHKINIAAGIRPGGRAESPHVQVNRLLAGPLLGEQANVGAIPT
jgi:hypothetical protein